MAIEIERPRKFTADEFERMVEAGIFREDERLELIGGEIVQMAPIGHRHAACVANLNKRLVTGVGDRALVWVQGPARLAIDSVPEPDLALLRSHSYRRGAPRPDDVLLVVEVAESSLRYDQTVKLPLYAGAGSPTSGSASTTSSPDRPPSSPPSARSTAPACRRRRASRPCR